MGFFSREPAITGEERLACISYYEKEKKLRFQYDAIETVFNNRISKHEHALSQARKSKESIMDGILLHLEKIAEVYEYIQKAANDLAERKKKIINVPPAAVAVSSAWQAVYVNYIAFRDPSNIVAGSNPIDLAQKRARAKIITQSYNNSLINAREEERKFCKQLKLNVYEIRKIDDQAAQALKVDTWIQNLVKSCP